MATIRSAADDSIEVTVAPTLISKNSVLASVNGVFNAIALKGDLVGEALFYGRGAGRKPTASSVVGDLVEAAFMLDSSRRHVGFASHTLYGTSSAAAEICSCYYLRLTVEDQPGVLGKIASMLGEAGIGLASVVQPESMSGTETSLVFMTHQASYGMISSALKKIQQLSCVKSKPVVFNVEAV